MENTDIKSYNPDGVIFNQFVPSVIKYVELFESDSYNEVPEYVKEIESIDLQMNSSMIVPSCVRHIEDLTLRHSSFIKINDGLEQIDSLWLEGATSIDIPESVKNIVEINCVDFSYVVLSNSVENIEKIGLRDASCIIFSDGYILKGPVDLTGIKACQLLKEHKKIDGVGEKISKSGIVPEAKIVVFDSETEIGHIWLKGDESYFVPDNIKEVKGITLFGSSSCKLSNSVKVISEVTLANNSSLSLNEGLLKIKCSIELHDSTTLYLPDSIQELPWFDLRGSSSIVFPDGFILKADDLINDDGILLGNVTNKLLAEHHKFPKKEQKAVQSKWKRDIYKKLCRTSKTTTKGKKI